MKHCTKRNRYQQAGFTLLEVLVATVVLGTAVAALFGLLSGALRNAERLHDPERALLLGQMKMNELLVLGKGSAQAAEEMPLGQTLQGLWDEQYRWEAISMRVRPTSNEASGGMALVQVKVDVYWKRDENDEERKLALESYQLRQPNSGSRP